MINKESIDNENKITKKEIIVDGLIFSLNKEENTAEVVGCKSQNKYFIPRSVTFENQEFKVISINEFSFKNMFIYSLKFPEDSEVCKIKKNAFQNSHIEDIDIPASVTDLEEGWNAIIYKLSNITISPNNKHYKKQDNLIIGKNSNKSDSFDILVSASRDIKTVTIPPGIKRIASYSFSYSSIEKVTFPPSVSLICEFAFYNCLKLRQIEIEAGSQLQTIEFNAFCLSSIESLVIPASLSELKEGWCKDAKKLTKVTIDKNNPHFKNDEADDKLIIGKSNRKCSEFDVLIFASRDIRTTTIPPNIKRISSYCFAFSAIESIAIPPSVTVIDCYAFANCYKLAHVEIPPDSQLELINNYAFYFTKIRKIFIPRGVIRIGEKSFESCSQLEQIDFASGSKLRTIESCAFGPPIRNITIPASVLELKDGWCSNIKNLINVTIESNNPYFKKDENDDKLIIGKSDNKSDVFDILVFASRNVVTTKIPPNIRYISSYSFFFSTITNIVIPQSVKEINSGAFYCCKQLQSVKIPKDSQLEKFGSSVFYFTAIRQIFIPAKVISISIESFSLCKKLRRIEFAEDSQLQIIEEDAFAHSQIASICIPKHVTQIKENAFYECYNLQIIEVSEQSSITRETLNDVYCKFVMVPKSLKKQFLSNF